MQITSNLQSSSIANDLSATRPAGKGSSRQTAGQDEVQISSLASQLSADPSKLDQLKAAYDSGTYNVSPAQIANSILNDALRG